MILTPPADELKLRRRWERDSRYQQLVELAADAILVHDDGWIVLANAAAVRLAGATSREQLIGVSIDRFLDPPYLKAVQSHLTGVEEYADDVPLLRDTLHRLDGTDLEVEVRAMGFLDDDRPSVHLVIRDISVRLETERQNRRLAERLQEAQRMETVGALAGGVAHEVNNMMQVILGYTGFVLEDARLPPERVSDLHEILAAADRASAITRQLLAYSRRAVHHPVVVDLGAVAHQSESVIRRLLGPTRPLHFSVSAVTPVWADPGQLQQVMINLALNARDAMPEGGRLTITTEEVEMGEGMVAADSRDVPPGRYGVLIVADTGCGMDGATLARMFEPFFSTKPTGQGTGLGLSAVHGIVTQSSGYLLVSTAPGEGTTFTIYLPLAPVTDGPPVSQLPSCEAPPRPPPGLTVLVIDDEPAVRAVASRMLEREGYAVMQSPGGSEAIDLVAKQGPPDVVLTDVVMPGVNGMELAREFAERWPDVPIVFMSGHSRSELLRHGPPGMDIHLIPKPFVMVELLAGIAEALTRARVAHHATL